MSNCPVCGGINTREIAPFRHRNPIFAACARAICADCEMMFASPMPSDQVLSTYNARYFQSAHGGQPTDPSTQAFFRALAGLRLAFVQRFIEKHRSLVNGALELGPGPGFFAQRWLEVHPSCTYSAVETDRSCHEALDRLGVRVVQDPAADVDLVVMSHVLEHVPNPVGFLRAATAGLKAGGVLFIEVPCQDWAHKDLDEPHVLFFEKSSLEKLLVDQGFIDIEIGYFGQPIRKLRSISPVKKFWNKLRARLISKGLVRPFARVCPGMELLTDPLERAVVAPFLAHEESVEPAWWLRAIARKSY